MTRRSSNRERSLWTVGLLDIGERDRVLELGFGPGLALQAAARRASRGLVVGLDHSETMHAWAGRRNRRAIRDGRVKLVARSLDALAIAENADPAPSGFAFADFHRVLAVNVLLFSEDVEAVLRGIYGRMAPGGRLAITFQPRRPGATDADARAAGDDLATRLREIGFIDPRCETLPLEPVCAVCVLATRPGRT